MPRSYRRLSWWPSTRRHTGAFTLLELLVVLVLVSIMMAVSVPRFRTTVLTDPLKKSARQIIGTIKQARQRAAESPLGCSLIVSIDEASFSLFCPQPSRRPPPETEELEDFASFDDDDESDSVSSEPVQLLKIDDSSRIRSVWNGASTRFSIGEVSLWITSDGLMEPSVINLSDGSRELGLTIYPFLTDIRIDDEAVVPDDLSASEALL